MMAFHFIEYAQRFDPAKIEKGMHMCKGVWYCSVVQFSDWLVEFFVKMFHVHTRYNIALKSGTMYILIYYEVSLKLASI